MCYAHSKKIVDYSGLEFLKQDKLNINDLKDQNKNIALKDAMLMKAYLQEVDYEDQDMLFDLQDMLSVKNKLEKNIKLFSLVKEMQQYENLYEISYQNEDYLQKINELFKQAKEIFENNENLFLTKTEYKLNIENIEKELHQTPDTFHLQAYNKSQNYQIDKDFILSEIKNNPEKLLSNEIRTNNEFEKYQLELDAKKARDLEAIQNKIDENQKQLKSKKQEIMTSLLKTLEDIPVSNEEIVQLKEQIKQTIQNENSSDWELGWNNLKNKVLQELNKSKNNGLANTAVGYDNFVSGDYSIAIGVSNTIMANNSVAVGNNNTLTKDAINTFLLGSNVTATLPNSVVLGHESSLEQAVNVPSITLRGAVHAFAGTTPVGTVSMGSEGKERQLHHVAAGRITNTSTDAVNGSQLYAVVDELNKLTTSGGNINPQDVSDEVTNQIETKLVAGKNINIDKDEATKTFTISATDTNTQSVVKAGNGVNVSAADNAQGTKDYTVSVSDALIKAGNNVEITGDAQSGFTINAKPATAIKAGEGVSVSGDSTNGYTITNTAQDANTQSVTKAGQGVTVTVTDNAQGTKDYTIAVKTADGLTIDGNGGLKVNDNLVKGGKNTEVSGNAKDGFTINAKGAELTAGDNITLSGNASDGYTITAKNTQSVVKAGDGVLVAESDNTQGIKDYTVSINTGNGLTTNNGKVSVKDDLVKAGQGITISGNAENGFTVNAKGTQLTAGDNIRLTGDAVNGYTITAVATAVEVTKDQLDDLVNKVGKIVDTNTQSVTKAGQGVTVTETDNAQGTKDYTVSVNTGAGLKLDNGKVAIKEDLIKAGNGVTVSGNAENGFTVTAKGTQLTAGDNITLTGDATNGYTVTAKNSQSVTKAGDGISVTATDNAQGTKDYTISIKDGLVKAGDNVKVSGNAKDGFTLSATNTQSTSSVVPNKGLAVTTTNNADGTKNYAFEAKIGDGLGFDENGNIKINNNLVKAGDNIEVSGNAKDGYTMSVDNMRSVVEGGQGASVAVKENADGSKTYTVTIKAGEGLTVDSQGNIVNDLKLQAGDNVKVSGNAKDGYTLSAIDTNTQATVSAVNQTGIVVTTTNNANGTKNYDVSAKLGDGLYVNDKGEISATAKTMRVEGDGKNIITTTDSKGDVSVKLAENLDVKSVKTGDVSISTVGIYAGNRTVTGVADGEIAPNSTEAVNGGQLYVTHQYINQMAGQVVENTQNIQQLNGRVGNVEQRLDRTSKNLRAGVAGAVATASLPQVYGAGKSMVSAATGHYKNQNAVAVGYSRASDNGKLVFKVNSSANTRGDFTIGTGIGYQW